MNAVDTSVAVPALIAWHADHDHAGRAAMGASAPAHVLVETYSVLTRLAPPSRVDGRAAAAAITRRFAPERHLHPSRGLVAELPTRLAEAGIVGGATYDALIALTADEAGALLLTRDVRATRTYEALGVAYRLIEDGSASASA